MATKPPQESSDIVAGSSVFVFSPARRWTVTVQITQKPKLRQSRVAPSHPLSTKKPR
jgi:hypothetical protein